jgi:hypothetical protein
METRFLRNKDLIDQKLLDEVMVIGLGGIGSALIPPLAIMGFRNIVGYDDDIVETHNLSTTMYPMESLGKSKAEVARDAAKAYGCTKVEMFNKRFERGTTPSPNTIVCTDSMSSRKLVYEAWAALDKRNALVDIRMGALSVVVVTITAQSDGYMDYWQDDKSIADDPCTMKHTIFTAEIAAGIGINQLFAAMSQRLFHKKIWFGLQPLRFECEKMVTPQLE